MMVKEAVGIAKDWVKDILADEHVTNVGLEEVDRDEDEGVWNITIGFSRLWNSPTINALSPLSDRQTLKRAYRIISIRDPNGEVISMRKRDGDTS